MSESLPLRSDHSADSAHDDGDDHGEIGEAQQQSMPRSAKIDVKKSEKTRQNTACSSVEWSGVDRSHLPTHSLLHRSVCSVPLLHVCGCCVRDSSRYPFCLVWGPLPLISWIVPWIGHLGVADSQGVVHDFAGPYTVNQGEFMVPITKVFQFPLSVWRGREREWDAGLAQADAVYSKLVHNLFTQNCHHHSVKALGCMKLGSGREVTPLAHMSMLQAFWLITRKGQFISVGAWIMTYAPFMIGLLFWAWFFTRMI